jgi:hypothetical protein
MADKITLTDRVYIVRRVNYGSDVDVNVTNQIVQTVDETTLAIDDDQVTHVGVTRNGDLVSDILDDLLYEDLTVSTFTINGSPTLTREKGNTLDDITFVWTYNKSVVSQSITGIALTAEERTKVLAAQGILVDTTWLLTGNDGTNDATDTVSALFRHSVRWIAMSEQAITSEILHTWDSELRADKNTIFTVDAASDEFIYFASPQSFGSVELWIGGFLEVFTETSFEYTNQYGVVTDYFIYKSENSGLGETTVTTQ